VGNPPANEKEVLMRERRIFLWMGLIVLFLPLALGGRALAEERYRVKPGDNLIKIAKKHHVSVESIRKVNNLADNSLKPKQILIIPTKDRKGQPKVTARQSSRPDKIYTVRKGDTLSSIAKKTGLSQGELKKINHLTSSRLKPGQRLHLAALPIRSDRKESLYPRGKQGEEALPDGEEELLDEEDVGDVDLEESVGGEEDHNASFLGKWRSPEERSLFVKVAKGFLGAPYRLGGNSVRGLDCSAFVKKIYEFFDVSLPRTAREQARVGVKVPKEELQEGDLVFFNTRRAYGHVGIYIGNNQFVHASSGRKAREVKIDSLDKPYYNKRFVKAVRLKEIPKAENDL